MSITRRSALKTLAAGTLGAATGLGLHGYLYERYALQVVRVRMPVSGLAVAHEGLRIGLLTDVHHSAFVSQADIVHAVQLLMAERPDLIVLGGDYVTNFDDRYLGGCVEALRPLSAPHGVFAIMGNHDDERPTGQALMRAGFAVLRDARTTIVIRGERLDLAGIRFWTRQPEEIARVVRGARNTTILLAHDPRRFVQALELAIPAVLSGHTHGGQVVIPGIGPIAARKYPVVAGLAERKDGSLFVSRGVGTVYVPIRINCPPDVSVITLTPRRPS
jgi:predicted MPP superfamily phosphohydrolase